MKKPTAIEILTVIISGCAFVLSLMHGCQTVQSNKIAVRPNIDITYQAVRGSTEPHGFKIKNSGVGPAIIKDVVFFVDGEKITTPKFEIWKTIFTKIGLETSKDFSEFHITHLPDEYYLQKGQNEHLLKLLPDSGRAKRELTNPEWQKLKRVSVKVYYTSMHDESFTVHYTPANDEPYVRGTY